VENILKERNNSYGDFACNACLAQKLKDVIRRGENWNRFSPSQREALDQVMSKVSRVLTGDPLHEDSWKDMVGYLTLIVKELTITDHDLFAKHKEKGEH